MARIADRAGVDLVSVGDSVGMNLWGRTEPEDMTVDEMILCCRAVGDARHLEVPRHDAHDLAALALHALQVRETDLWMFHAQPARPCVDSGNSSSRVTGLVSTR
jgi:hypothetical protein